MCDATGKTRSVYVLLLIALSLTLITKLKYMDLSSPTPTTNIGITPVFGDNVQDLLGVGALNVKPTGIIVVNSNADTVRSLIVEGQEELMPYGVRFQRDCGSDGGDTV